MSTIQEIKEAAARLSAAERDELARWLSHLGPGTAAAPFRDWQNRWKRLQASVDAAVGPITWTREELHAR